MKVGHIITEAVFFFSFVQKFLLQISLIIAQCSGSLATRRRRIRGRKRGERKEEEEEAKKSNMFFFLTLLFSLK